MAFVIRHDSVAGVRKPDAAVGMDNNVVWSVKWLVILFVCEGGDAAVVFVANDAAGIVLAGELTSFEIEGVTIAVVGRSAKNADMIVLVEPAHLAIVRNVAPDQVTPDPVPRATFSPESAGPEALDGGVADFVFGETCIDNDDRGIGIARDRLVFRCITRARSDWQQSRARNCGGADGEE